MTAQSEVEALRDRVAELTRNLSDWESTDTVVVIQSAVDRADRAESFIGLCGYRRCDAPACNCGSWHSGPNVRAEKAEARVAELEAELRDPETGMPYEFGQLVARKNARIAELEGALRTLAMDADRINTIALRGWTSDDIESFRLSTVRARAALSGQAPVKDPAQQRFDRMDKRDGVTKEGGE